MEIKHTPQQDGIQAIKITAEENNKVLGWGFLYLIKNDRHEEPYGLLENVYVEKQYRGKGIGTKIVRALIEEAKRQGCYKLIGQSRYGREKVHELYKSFGFQDHGKNFRMDMLKSRVKQSD